MTLAIAFFIAIYSITGSDQILVRKYLLTGQAQGTTYKIIYYATDSIVTKKQVDRILDKIDSSLSLYKPYSLINQFNRSDSGITADEHFLTVVKRSIKTFEETNGIFDITVQPLVEAWGFGIKKLINYPILQPFVHCSIVLVLTS